MSDLSLSSLQAEMQVVAIEAAKSTQAIAHQTLHSIVVPALKKQRQQIKIHVDPKAAWDKYTNGIEGHQIDIAVNASRRALRDGQSQENVLQMLQHDPQAQKIGKQHGAGQKQRYIEIVADAAAYKEEKQAKTQQQQQLGRQRHQPQRQKQLSRGI